LVAVMARPDMRIQSVKKIACPSAFNGNRTAIASLRSGAKKY